MDPHRQIDHLAAIARDHQAEMLRQSAAAVSDRHPAFPWRAGLVLLACLVVPLAFFLVRPW